MVNISGVVWEDLNQNGILDTNEPTLEGVDVNVYYAADIGKKIYTEKTNKNGVYTFKNIKAGDYRIEVIKPLEAVFTEKDVGDDVTRNSKIDTDIWLTDIITLFPGEEFLYANVGIIKPATIEGQVWIDINKNGIKESDEFELKGVKVTLYNYNTKQPTIYNTITDDKGIYKFSQVLKGIFYIVFSKLEGYEFIESTNWINKRGESSNFYIQSGSKITINAPFLNIEDISIEKDVDFSLVEIGDELTYIITITNKGVLPMFNVIIKDKLPKGTRFIENSATINNSYIEVKNIEEGVNIGNINTKRSKILKFEVKVENRVPNINPLKNKAVIVYDRGKLETNFVETLIESSSLGGVIWQDLNGNGLKDIEEFGVEGILVNLYKFSYIMPPIKSIYTDKKGIYFFDNLRSGVYGIEVNLPIGKMFTIENVSENSNISSQVNQISGRSGLITLNMGKKILDINIGILNSTNIRGKIWLDSNKNNIIDHGEVGIGNGLVSVYFCDNRKFTGYFKRTNNEGNYEIFNIPLGSYYIKFNKIPGYEFLTIGEDVNENGESECFNLTATNNIQIVNASLEIRPDLLISKEVNLKVAEIGDILTYMIKILNNSEKNFENVKVIDKLSKGTKFIEESLRVNEKIIDNVNFEEGINIGVLKSQQASIVTFKVVISKEISVYQNKIINLIKVIYNGGSSDTYLIRTNIKRSSISGIVWEDINGNGVKEDIEPKIKEVKVELYSSEDLKNPILSTKTDNEGIYLFLNLKSGEYFVKFKKLTDSIFTNKDATEVLNEKSSVNISTGFTDKFILKIGETKENINCGIIKLAVIEGIVWLDLNRNNKKDENEKGVAQANITLYKCDSNEITEYRSSTDENGKFVISGILPGNFYAIFNKPSGYDFINNIGVIDNKGVSKCFFITSGRKYLDLNIALIDIKDVSMSIKTNLNLVQIGDELVYEIIINNKGIGLLNNVHLKCDITKGTRVITDSLNINNVNIILEDIQQGIFIPNIKPKTSLIIKFKVIIESIENEQDIITNKTMLSYNGQEKLNYTSEIKASKSIIGNFIWNDLNENGLIDLGEPGVEGINISLYKANDLNNPLKTIITDSQGEYLFDNLRSDLYIVKFYKPKEKKFTIKDIGKDKSKNSKANEITGITDEIFIGIGEKKLNIDAGLISESTKISKTIINFKVWQDKNKNGKIDDGEPGVEGILITLYTCKDGKITNYSAITDRNGEAKIQDVIVNEYYAKFNIPRTYEFVTTGRLINLKGESNCFYVKEKEFIVINAPIINIEYIEVKDIEVIKSVNLSSAELDDELIYHIKITNVSKVPILNIKLIDEFSSAIILIENSLKINEVIMEKGNLYKGINLGGLLKDATIYISFKANINNINNLENIIINRAIVNFDGKEKLTNTVTTEIKRASIEGVVWEDLNKDGLREEYEPFIEGVKVNLYLAKDKINTIQSIFTNKDGMYSFLNLKSGQYLIEFIKEKDKRFSKKNVAKDLKINSKVNEDTAFTDIIFLSIGENKKYINAGILPYEEPRLKCPTIICGRIINVCTEEGVENIEVYLLTSSGKKLKYISNYKGKYYFKVTKEGTYKVVFGNLCNGKYLTAKIIVLKVNCEKHILNLCTKVKLNKILKK